MSCPLDLLSSKLLVFLQSLTLPYRIWVWVEDHVFSWLCSHLSLWWAIFMTRSNLQDKQIWFMIFNLYPIDHLSYLHTLHFRFSYGICFLRKHGCRFGFKCRCRCDDMTIFEKVGYKYGSVERRCGDQIAAPVLPIFIHIWLRILLESQLMGVYLIPTLSLNFFMSFMFLSIYIVLVLTLSSCHWCLYLASQFWPFALATLQCPFKAIQMMRCL